MEGRADPGRASAGARTGAGEQRSGEARRRERGGEEEEGRKPPMGSKPPPHSPGPRGAKVGLPGGQPEREEGGGASRTDPESRGGERGGVKPSARRKVRIQPEGRQSGLPTGEAA